MAVPLVCLDAFAQAKPGAEPGGVDFRWGMKVPMRDGVQLNATVYLPKQAGKPHCVFTLTPYVADSYHDRGMYFASHGVPFLSVDSRGRGNSQGEFTPLLQEAQDGHDVVEWLAAQPWCNGKVGMWGGSYSGYNQWATAKELPPHLATFVPVASVFPGRDFPMRNNLSYPYVMQWLTYTSGKALQAGIFADPALWAEIYREGFESGASFASLDQRVGNPSKAFQEWVSHPHPDAYWDRHNPTPTQYAGMQMPILTITGSYDSDQPGALGYYSEHLRHATPEARKQHYLVIGPWDHAGTRKPMREFGGLKFGPQSLVDLQKLHLQWYAWAMADGPKPEFLRKPVAYYVMGAETWRYADSLEAVTERMTPYFLDSATNADEVFTAGSLSPGRPGKGAPDRYVYDPADVSLASQETVADRYGYASQKAALERGGRQLYYHTAPMQADTEISGFFKLSAWLSIDRPDTDFMVSVHEIDRDGNSVLLSSDAMRARYREDVRQPKLITTAQPLRYDFEQFTFVSRLVRKGSRLRLTLGPVDSIYRQKNFNSGKPIAQETLADAQAVKVALHHDAQRPSVLYVPFGHAKRQDELSAPSSMFLVSKEML